MKFCLIAAFLTLSISLKVHHVQNHHGQKINHNGNSAAYFFNQGPTGNRCTSSTQCDGLRTCSFSGWCQGTSRPVPKTTSYYFNQGPLGNRCSNDYQCDGLRTCSYAKWCQGTSR